MAEKIKIYEYKQCSTCRKALKYLEEKGIVYKKLPIRETPPSKAELKKMLTYLGGDKKLLFNRSGKEYREMDLKSKLAEMPEQEAIELLLSNGNLIKRPFVITPDGGMVGFNEGEWNEKFK